MRDPYSRPSLFESHLIHESPISRETALNFCWNGLLLLFIRLIREFLNSRVFLVEPTNRELGWTTVLLIV